MKFGLDVPTTGAYADPRRLAGLAVEAEAAGWDGFFVWDVLLGGPEMTDPVLDPWVALAALALQTTRLRLGVLATPLARHRPWLVARRLANLDQLSGGRMICTVGLGYQEREFAAFGEAGDAGTRARTLDEALAVLAGLWGEAPFSFQGEHYTINQVIMHPRPAQTPRIPIWVAAGWPRRAPLRRAAQWDGVCLKSIHQDTRQWLTPDDLLACLAYLETQRSSPDPFDVVVSGEMAEDRPAAVAQMREWATAGATWWMEEGLGWTFEEFRERIRQGPPREE